MLERSSISNTRIGFTRFFDGLQPCRATAPSSLDPGDRRRPSSFQAAGLFNETGERTSPAVRDSLLRFILVTGPRVEVPLPAFGKVAS